MSIKDYLLNEKVSRNEIRDALNNDNVMVGAEFEFTVPPFLEKYNIPVSKHEKMQDMTAEYMEYEDRIEQWQANPYKVKKPKIPDWAIKQGYKEGEAIPPPEEVFKNLNVNVGKLFQALLDDYIMPISHKLPFSKSEVIFSPISMTKSSTKWVVKPDGSLGLSGVEMVTPIMPLKQFLDVCPKVFDFISGMKENAAIGDECGFHISMSLKNVSNLGEALDVTKLAIMLDEGYIYNFFEKREFNTYAKSAHDTINKVLIGRSGKELASKIINEPALKKGYPTEHYMAINIEHLDTPNKYIEFRYIGSANYHRKWDKIKAITAHYAHDLSMACDPSYKKKEYEVKFNRFLNKIQLFTVVTTLTEMKNDEELDKTDPINRKNWKDAWETWNALKHYKEAVDNDKETKHGRRGFLRMCSMLGIKEDELIWDFSKDKNFMLR